MTNLMETIDEVITGPKAPETFSGWYACDSCATAQAMWKVIGNSGELFLCGHHKNKMEAGLTAWATEFVPLKEPSMS